jgi:hypothetical protein
MLHYTVLRYITSCCVIMLCYVMLCYAMLCYESPLCSVILENLMLALLVNTCPVFYGTESSLPCSQQLSTGAYPKPDEFNPRHKILLHKDPL